MMYFVQTFLNVLSVRHNCLDYRTTLFQYLFILLAFFWSVIDKNSEWSTFLWVYLSIVKQWYNDIHQSELLILELPTVLLSGRIDTSTRLEEENPSETAYFIILIDC